MMKDESKMTDAARPVDVKRVGQSGLAMHVRGDLGGGVILLQSTHRLALSVRSEEGRAILYQDDGDGPVTELARFSSLETANNALADLTRQLGELDAANPAPLQTDNAPAARQPMGQMALAGLAGMALTLLITLSVGANRQAAPGNISVTLDMPEGVVTALANGATRQASETAAVDQATGMLDKYLAMQGDQEETIANLTKLAEQNPNIRFNDDGTPLLPPELRQQALANAGSALAGTDDDTTLLESVRTGEQFETLLETALSDDAQIDPLQISPRQMLGQQMVDPAVEEALDRVSSQIGSNSRTGQASQGASAIVIAPQSDRLVESLKEVGRERDRIRRENDQKRQEMIEFQYMQMLELEQDKKEPPVPFDALGLD